MKFYIALVLLACVAQQGQSLVGRHEDVTLEVKQAPESKGQSSSAAPAVATAAPPYAPPPPAKTWKDEVAEMSGAVFGPKVGAMSQHEWWVIIRTLMGYCVLGFGVWMWVWYFPNLYRRSRECYEKEMIEGRTFNMYLTYHFNNWMSVGGLSSMFTLLGIMMLSLLTACAFIYAILMQESPVKGLWLCTVWASAASVDPAVTAMEGGVGMISTFGGLVLLAVLLTSISDFFAQKQKVSNEGRDPIVEGGHLVLLGLSTQTKTFLEELAICETSGAPKTVAILDSMPKIEIEEEIHRQHIRTGNLKIVCRAGLSSSAEDLWKVGADVASRVVILDEPSLPRDEADAITFGTLLTLRGQGASGWPQNGHISVQCALGKNVAFMNTLYPGKTFVLSGERLGRLMVQSAQDQGLCPIFNQIVGFEGDEFYTGNAVALGLNGKSFQEVPFWCEKTVPIGVRGSDGSYNINPPKSYVVQDEDEVIMLAEDDDALGEMSSPLLDFPAWLSTFGAGRFAEHDPNDKEVVKVLICNFTERGYGCAILFALDEMCAAGSECDIFCSRSEKEVHAIVASAEQESEKTLTNIKLRRVYTAPSHRMTSHHKIDAMPLASYDFHFVLADSGLSFQKADEQTVAMIIQMTSIMSESSPDQQFSPLVEICTPTSRAQLALCGVGNTINTTAMMSCALALVAIDTLAHGVLSDLLSAGGNNLDITFLQDYLNQGEHLPEMVSFAEVTAIVNRGVQQCVIGWSEGSGIGKQWIVNPKDKVTPRAWSPEDKIVVIKDVTVS
eukprot:gb/GFBE01022110.1/.p1 GENE.gb/GFBE01022110.1/~~gb/GFBE01022110.1/.p1  ORF type:complete len:782 (+),score=168.42 gb/GFBE01022110.1/:1-2346(+)